MTSTFIARGKELLPLRLKALEMRETNPKISAAQVARQLGVNNSTVSHWLTKGRVSLIKDQPLICSKCGRIFNTHRGKVAHQVIHKIQKTTKLGETKRCSHCKQVKPISNFSKDSTRASGLRTVCRSCEAVRWQARVNPNQPQIELQAKYDELLMRHIEYAAKIVELQNQIASENWSAH